jgi:hypothetical protein
MKKASMISMFLVIFASMEILGQGILNDLFFSTQLDSAYSSFMKSLKDNQLLKRKSENMYEFRNSLTDPLSKYIKDEKLHIDISPATSSSIVVQFYPMNGGEKHELEIFAHRKYKDLKSVHLLYNLILEKLIKYFEYNPEMSYRLSGTLEGGLTEISSTYMSFKIDKGEKQFIDLGIEYLNDNNYSLYIKYYNRDAIK